MPLAEKLDLPDYVIRVLLANRTPVEHLVEQLEADALHLQKVTLNFWKEPDGTYHSRNDVLAYLKGIPGIVLVNGGFANLGMLSQEIDQLLDGREPDPKELPTWNSPPRGSAKPPACGS